MFTRWILVRKNCKDFRKRLQNIKIFLEMRSLATLFHVDNDRSNFYVRLMMFW